MKKRVKAIAARLLFALLLMLLCINLNSLDASASVRDNKGKVLFSNNKYMKVTIGGTSLQYNDIPHLNPNYLAGYYLDLKFENKYTKPVFVNVYVTKINGKNLSSPLAITRSIEQEGYPHLSGYLSSFRIGKGATVSRPAVISFSTLLEGKVNRVKNIDGYIKIIDTTDKILLNEKNGTFHAALEDDSSNDEILFNELTGAKFNSSDNSSIKGAVVFNLSAFKKDSKGDYDIYCDYQNTTSSNLLLTASYKDGSKIFSFYLSPNIYSVNRSPSYLGDNSKLENLLKNKAVEPVTYTLKNTDSGKVISTKNANLDFGKIIVIEDSAHSYQSLNVYFVNKNDSSKSCYNTFYIGDDPRSCKLALDDRKPETSIPHEKIVWSSSDESIATIDSNGNITLTGVPGVTIIRAAYGTLIFQKALDVRSPKLVIYSKAVACDDFIPYDYSIYPESMDNFNVSIKTEDENIAVMGPYKRLYGKSEGITKIIATASMEGYPTPLTAEAYIRVLPKREETTELKNKPIVKAPSLNASGLLFKEDNVFSISLDSAQMVGSSYRLDITEECLGAQPINSDITITSINGLKVHSFHHGYTQKLKTSGKITKGTPKKHTFSIGEDVFAQLGTMEISELRGTVDYLVENGKHSKWPFVIKPGTGTATSYVRRTPSGKDLSLNFKDISAEVTSIYERCYNHNLIESVISLYIQNKSKNNTYQFSAYINKVNEKSVNDNYIFNTLKSECLYPGEKMYGNMIIPEEYYITDITSINSLSISVTIRDMSDKVSHDETVVLNDLSKISRKAETLDFDSYPKELFVGQEPYYFSVYEDGMNHWINRSKLTYSTSDETVLSITADGGLIARKPGVVLVTVTDEEGRMGVLAVGVNAPKLSFVQQKQTLDENSFAELSSLFKVEPADLLDKITFKSSDESVATFNSDGYLITKAPGKVTLTATYADSNSSYSDSCELTVKKMNSLELSDHELIAHPDSSGNYRLLSLHAGNDDLNSLYNVTWTSSNTTKAEIVPFDSENYNVPSGYSGSIRIKPIAPGTATITASYGGKTATCKIIIKDSSGEVPEDEPGENDEPQNPGNEPASDTPSSDASETGNTGNDNAPTVIPVDSPSTTTTETGYKKGDKFTDPTSGAIYVITSDSEVRFEAISNKKVSKIIIPENVTIGSKKYAVTSIGSKAFKNCKKLKSIIVGKNVSKLNKNAFKGLKDGTKITLTAKNKKTYNKLVKKYKKAGAKKAKFKFKKLK
ncbi:leucine-rich repeat protein [Butyrivibrio sp. VCD2006]|uniref:leucine-rich repeat protein n=1 Tax=Butyrivibrio sp. VCD2006 TaxID=1280664 RepID=UPI0003F55E4C|nr:leucine-rich repeat protein [Butyrivibrio sp. VCD2006]